MSDYLVIGGWSGRQKIPVQVLNETADGFWIKPEERAFLPGRGALKRASESSFQEISSSLNRERNGLPRNGINY